MVFISLTRKFISFFLVLFLCSNVWAAIDLDGDNGSPSRGSDYIKPTDIVLTGSFTLSAWVYSDVNPSNNNNHGIIVRNKSTTFFHNYYLIKTSVSGNGTWKCGFRDSTGGTWRELTSTTNGTINQWVHVACTFDTTTKRFDLYVNGTSVANNTWAGATPNNAGTLAVGYFYEEGNSTFGGKIEEVSIYDTCLTPSDIKNLASRVRRIPLQISSSNLKIYLPLDDGQDGTSADGDVLRDYSSTNDTVTCTDGADNTGCSWFASNNLSYP